MDSGMPSWWRGEAPTEPRPSAALVLRGDVEELDLRALDRSGGDGLAHVSLREAGLRGLDLCLDDTKLDFPVADQLWPSGYAPLPRS